MAISVSSANQTYLAGNSVDLLPAVSGEWNYNLVYGPYATFTGLNTVDTLSLSNDFTNPANWIISSGYTSCSRVSTGKVTSVFKSNTAIQFLVSPNGSYTDTNNFTGSSYMSFNVATPSVPLSTKGYKIVFYAKSIDNNIINLVSQASNSDGSLSGTTSTVIDNVDWQKVEIIAGFNLSDPTAPGYANFNLNLDFTNNTLSSTTAWGLIVSNVRIYEISYFDYLYGKLYSTDDVFTYFRPGESYVTSGNNQIPNNTRTSSNVSAGWNNNLPCSSVTYSPRVLFSSPQSPLYKNGVLTTFSRYKYYVSESIINPVTLKNRSTSIGAAYSERLATNKIVIKLNIGQSVPDNLTITLWDNGTNATTPVSSFTLSSTDIASTTLPTSGELTLYWQGSGNGFYGSGWGTTKWSWSPTTNSGMPFINSSGNISMYVGGIAVNGYQYIDKITLTQGSATPLSNYRSLSSTKPDAYQELQRFQVIEISPRLELDLTQYTISVDINKTLDDKGTPLPISSMSANAATVQFSNIPLSGQNITGIPAPLSIFSTNANASVTMPSGSSTISPLTGMLVKNVKIYLNYYLPTQSNTIIPGGVFYVDSWDNQDIKTTKANCFDIMKFLQTVPVSDYVSESQSLLNVITNILDFAGFTDYDYDSLVSITTDNVQKISTSFFYADSANKTVYSILQEAFLAYQISCWIDEYGVMRFKNLQSILTNTSTNWTINDSNIILDSYNENIKTKLGKVLLRYRVPQIKRSVGAGTDVNKATSILQVAPDVIWSEASDNAVTFNLLKDSIPNLSQNFYTTDAGSFTSLFFGNSINHSGYCIIENEIMSSGSMEFVLTGQNQDATGAWVNVGQPKSVYPSNDSELTYEVAQFSNSVNATKISQDPTGRYMNVQRGLFGSKAKAHKVMSSAADFDYAFSYYQMPTNSGTLNGPLSPLSVHQNIIQVPLGGNGTKSLVIPKNGIDQGYSTYSAKFKFPTAPTDVSAGIFFNMNGLSALSSQVYFVELRATGANNSVKKTYMLNFYQTNSSGTVTQLIKQINMTGYLLADFDNEPDDGLYLAEMGNYINIKFVKTPSKNVIYINKHRILIDTIDLTTGAVSSNKWLTSSGVNPATITGSAGSNFGFFASTPTGTTSTVQLQEIYATQSPVDEPVSYYFQTRQFLNSLIQDQNIKEKSYFVQSRPQIIGLNFYDVQLNITPSLGAEIFKSSYSYYYYPNNVDPNAIRSNKDIISSHLVRVRDDAIGYSDITSTGFRAKFALVNASQHVVFTKATSNNSQLVNAELLVASRGFINLTPQITAERVFSLQNVNEVLELQSDWIQNKKTADNILKVVALGADPFSKDISVEVFGNPLIQIGDVVNMTYSLKNISGITFVVTGVTQSFGNGLTTKITMNQITYNGVTKANLAINYPAGSNLGNAPTITDIRNVTTPGNDVSVFNLTKTVTHYQTTGNAGDTVTLTGTNFGTDSVVFFGKASATVSNITSTQLTVTVPVSSSYGPIDVTVVSGGKTGSTFGMFSYLTPASQVAVVSNVVATLGAGAYGFYNATLSWTVTGTNYDHYNISQVGSGTWGPDNLDTMYVSDSGTHTVALSSLYADYSYSWTITPIYTDANGVQSVGNSVTSNILKTSLVTGGGANPPLAPTVTASPTVVARTAYAGSTLITLYDVTFTYTMGANSDEVYGYVTTGSTPLLIATSTTNSITFPQNSAGSTTFSLYGGKQGTANQSATAYVKTFDPSTFVTPAPGVPAATGQLQTPVLVSSSFIPSTSTSGKINAVIQLDTTDTPKPSGYTLSVVSTNQTGFWIPLSNNQTASTVANTSINSPFVGVGPTYTVTVVAHDVTKTYTDSNPVTFTVSAAPDPATFPAVTVRANALGGNGVVIYWDLAGTVAFYDSFNLNYYDSSGVTKTLSVTKAYAMSNVGTIQSPNGINFTDTTYATSNTFTPGSTLTAEVTGIYAGVAGTTYTATVTVPQTVIVYAPSPFAMTGPTTAHPSAKIAFIWSDATLSNGGTVLGYNWELYSGATVNSLNLLSNGFTTFIPSNTGWYEVGTSRTTNMMFRVQTVSLSSGNSAWAYVYL
jgi:hypothetical protein